MEINVNVTACRLCDSTNLTNVISLGNQIITSRFPNYGDFSTPKTPIDLCVCGECRFLTKTLQPKKLTNYVLPRNKILLLIFM